MLYSWQLYTYTLLFLLNQELHAVSDGFTDMKSEFKGQRTL